MDQVRIVLAGRTGSGKSTTGNTILGRKAFEACMSASSVTDECQRETVTIDETSYVIVDTPGLFDTRISRVELAQEVVRCVAMSSPGPHIFLLTVNVGRFTREEIDCFKEMFELFGEKLNRFSLIVFTGKDQLQMEGTSIEKFISDCKELKDIIAECNHNYIAINNKAKGNVELELLMDKIHSIISLNRYRHYTNEMFEEAELAFKRKAQTLQEEADRKKKEEHDKIRAEMHELVKSYENDNKVMLQKISELENEKHEMKHDKQQVELITTTIESLNITMQSMKTENARMIANMEYMHMEEVNRIPEESQEQMEFLGKGREIDQRSIKKMEDRMKQSEEEHKRTTATLSSKNKKLEEKNKELEEKVKELEKEKEQQCTIS